MIACFCCLCVVSECHTSTTVEGATEPLDPTGRPPSLSLSLLSSTQSPLPLVNAHADEIIDFLLHILGDADTEMNLKDCSALVRTTFFFW